VWTAAQIEPAAARAVMFSQIVENAAAARGRSSRALRSE
jgi:hypothetical protein